MTWGFQVYVADPTPDEPKRRTWKWCKPSGSHEPYEWDTKAEAEEMARICYGNDPTIVRVKEISL